WFCCSKIGTITERHGWAAVRWSPRRLATFGEVSLCARLWHCEEPGLEIFERLDQLLPGIHYEWPMLRNGFIQGLARNQKYFCRAFAVQGHAIRVGIIFEQSHCLPGND